MAKSNLDHLDALIDQAISLLDQRDKDVTERLGSLETRFESVMGTLIEHVDKQGEQFKELCGALTAFIDFHCPEVKDARPELKIVPLRKPSIKDLGAVSNV